MKRILTTMFLLAFLPGCSIYQIMGPKIHDFDDFVMWAEDRHKIHDWMKRCTRYDPNANWGWYQQPNPKDIYLTESLAKSLWDHKRGTCGQFAAMYVWCGIRNRATCGYIHVRPDIYNGGHIMAWIEEQDSTISRTSEKDLYFSEYGSKKHMMDFWLSKPTPTIIYDGIWNEIGRNF